MRRLSTASFKLSVAPKSGADATTYWLVPSATQIKRKADGTHLPEYVSCESKAKTGEDSPVSGVGTIKYAIIYATGNTSADTIYQSRITITADMAGISFRLYVGGQKVDEKTVLVIDDGEKGKDGLPGPAGERGRLPFPAGKWDANTTYTATDDITPIVYYEDGKTYYVMRKNGSVTGLNPVEDYSNPAGDPTWIPFENLKVVFTEILMANWAKLASAVFFGDCMFSQYGKDARGNDTKDYSGFDPSKIGQSNCLFTPNLMMDLMKGEFRLGDKFVASIKNGKLDIVMQGKLQTSDTGERIVIDPDNKSITMYDSNGLKSIEMFIGYDSNGIIKSYSRAYTANGKRGTATLSNGEILLDDGEESVYPNVGNYTTKIFSNGIRLSNYIGQYFEIFNTNSYDGSKKPIVQICSSAWATSPSQVLNGGVYVENGFLKVK